MAGYWRGRSDWPSRARIRADRLPKTVVLAVRIAVEQIRRFRLIALVPLAKRRLVRKNRRVNDNRARKFLTLLMGRE